MRLSTAATLRKNDRKHFWLQFITRTLKQLPYLLVTKEYLKNIIVMLDDHRRNGTDPNFFEPTHTAYALFDLNKNAKSKEE